jgi:gas vesicle protein
MRRMLIPAIAGALAGLASAGALGQSAEDPRNEIKKLFEKVEKDLEEIDKLLLNASSEPAAAGAETTDGRVSVKQANGKQKEVVDSIQKILDLIPPSG